MLYQLYPVAPNVTVCYIAPYCTVLYCTVLYRTVTHCTVQQSTAMYCTLSVFEGSICSHNMIPCINLYQTVEVVHSDVRAYNFPSSFLFSNGSYQCSYVKHLISYIYLLLFYSHLFILCIFFIFFNLFILFILHSRMLTSYSKCFHSAS